MISWLLHTPKSSVSRYHMEDIRSRYQICYTFPLSIAMWPSINQVLETMPETFKTIYPSNALKTAPKYFVKSPHHCPPKALSTEGISNMPKDCLE